jgi:hypothetical protein
MAPNAVRNALIGLLVAATLGLVATDASLFGIAVWKITLAALGGAIFVLGGSSRRSS